MSSDDRGISDYYNVKIILQFLLTVVFFLYWICYRLKFDVRCICWSVLWCLAPLSTIFQSFISWWSVLLVEETRVPGENHQPVVSHWQTLSHNVVHLAMSGIRTRNISCIGPPLAETDILWRDQYRNNQLMSLLLIICFIWHNID
jgi:hypothetical protein